MRKTITLLLSASLILLSLVSNAEQKLLLSGRINAADNQTFYAPKTDNWRVQLQWMLPEGEIAKKGDLVIVFDSGSIQSAIEQGEVNLITAQEELHRITSQAKQDLLEAEFAAKRTALLLDKARIDAAITEEFLSQFEFETNQLNFEKALVDNLKAKESYQRTQIKNDVAITKQKLKITRELQQLEYNRIKLTQMSGYAQRSGPVLYGTHPWNGEKVFVGMTAQPSWKIAEIPSLKDLFIEAWVHEVDYKKIQLGDSASLTFDAFPASTFSAKLTEISTQPEERKEWGNDVYYRTVFTFSNTGNITPLPGMSALLELQEKQS
ncbi:hypothetical protein GCM10009111_07270 [Colwellia asteriadis]|uniref:HlyD family secretion protein n=1 Tax=Colwellia asteriadis TaxID=517723 RepID=A0ABN1L470_9GAMM